MRVWARLVKFTETACERRSLWAAPEIDEGRTMGRTSGESKFDAEEPVVWTARGGRRELKRKASEAPTVPVKGTREDFLTSNSGCLVSTGPTRVRPPLEGTEREARWGRR
ncbi:hypothetical protein TRVL_04771 [Trypanosoma vivax]|nr:hypothetical protein TRVL_04771 [Trypanosoma vivax]